MARACIAGATPPLSSIAIARASSSKTNKCSVKAHCAGVQRRYLLSLVASSLSFAGIEAAAQAKNTRDVPIFGIKKPKAIGERQEEEPAKKVADVADVQKSKKDASSVVLEAKGGSSVPSAGIQAVSVVAAELIGVVVASSLVNRILTPEA
eukprot:TRINITY_DN4939_c0_g1_i1.p1 TRINITY_DN4939_c0_g1~~TRINITY_DN4939_c0_g1_i1.p1  ORF type:complete len:151 (-),score=33.80 TRINITY_DN4939_c0_g1_i1:319-771(-)